MPAHRKLSKVQFRTYYHGTNPLNVESIQKTGLKQHNPAAFENPDWDEEYEFMDSPTGVYMSPDIDEARGYGKAVFAMDLPDFANWGWTGGEGRVLQSDIPPEMLKRVE